MSIGSRQVPGQTDAVREEHLAPKVEREAATTPASQSGGWAPADPVPLGLAAFALTTFVLSMFNSGLMNADKGEAIVLGLALAYGGLAQLLAGMWEFRTGNTFGATAFVSFGAFWLSFWAFIALYESKVPAGEVAAAVGLYLIAWGV